jgi:4-amino-4-deoxy-L-arabinose transferase-like glycosyltransferase
LYFVARRLFDDRLALLACAMVLLCDAIWQYSLSGLPQTLLMLLFNATVYCIVRAVEAQYRGGRVGLWLAATGAGFGMLALTHALTIWLFVAALIFFAIFFRPRIWAAVIPLIVFLAMYSPWLARNFYISGNPGGVAIYSVFDGVGHSEAGHMRRMELDRNGAGVGAFRDKMVSNFVGQTGKLFQNLGFNIVALMFIPALLHRFKKSEAGIARWIVVAMWAAAVLGMIVYGAPEEKGVAANQLHIVFAPLLTCFGLAFLLVQWNRLGIEYRLARIGFITLLFVLVALPMTFTFLARPNGRAQIHWPPYVPPYIAVLNDWMQPAEVTASDMPWAIAWYADRPAIWIPDSLKRFTELNDYRVIGRPLNGLYLTPISGTQNTLEDVLKGDYKDWASVILRSVDINKFPLKWATLLGMENECVFFSDHDRSKAAPSTP